MDTYHPKKNQVTRTSPKSIVHNYYASVILRQKLGLTKFRAEELPGREEELL
jgi:hypothetical protein